MRVLLLSLAVPLALAASPAPTVPTPRPTITPAPESECNYADDANGPFALDCLQREFLLAGCSIRGLSYPTEAQDVDTGDKASYNALTWQGVKDAMAALTGNTDACRGPPTPAPTQDPTLSPVTKAPSPSPTVPVTEHTPAPTYAMEYAFDELVKSEDESFADAAAAAEGIKEACEAAGYSRQYDATQYVVSIQMGNFIDYYTFAPVADAENGGQYTSICDMLADPDTHTPMWSDSPNGPFWEVDIATATDKLVDGRNYPSWLDHEDDTGKGFGADNPDEVTGKGGVDYILSITSLRSFSPCVERVDPKQNGLEAVCFGADAKWSPAEAEECNGEEGEHWNLRYALANRVFATCEDVCVYHPDYTEGDDGETQQGQFWYWKSGANCWEPRSAYADGAVQHCDPEGNGFQYEDEYAFAVKRQASLCTERCDYVNLWEYMNGSCYRKIDGNEYGDAEGDTFFLQARAFCKSIDTNADLASITSEAENDAVVTMCGGAPCYVGNDHANAGKAEGDWLNGDVLTWANWEGGYEGATLDTDNDKQFLTVLDTGKWKYDTAAQTYNALCEVAADLDHDSSNREYAMACMDKTADDDHMQTNFKAELDLTASGFTDAANPGNLHLHVDVPKYMYNTYITFEGATNDRAEYNWEYLNDLWTVNANSDPTGGNDDKCDEAVKLELVVPWTVFNLGGAGGVNRLTDYTNANEDNINPNTDLDTDDNFSNSKYIFGAVMRIEATQPVFTSVDVDSDEYQKREATFHRNVVSRVPFVLQFQKTVSVSTDVDIVSTKFNYKTVAAIIQSIQYDTQFFAPPYAKIKMQIRTKSQYPYMFNSDPATIELLQGNADGVDDNLDLAIEHLHDDVNCTFTNPDHTREGDICTQEWMLTVIPGANVCYATGEYTIIYTAACFEGKEVCYLPKNDAGDDIDTVSFTFKVQTSKFCPTVADEVDLSGNLIVTGRESFKPSDEDVEDATTGQYYLQGETIHFLASTSSNKAVITSTKVVMVEIEQDLSQLVMTGYNRVPYDDASEDMTVWTEAGDGRIADGGVKIDVGDGPIDVELMTDDYVFNSGSEFDDYTFTEREAGFKMDLHAKAFPVNVDSFGAKTVVATLEVTYEALEGNRRRLLAADRSADMRARTQFQLDAFKPNLESAKGDKVTMSMEMTLQKSKISRNNVRGFVQSFEDAVLSSIAAESPDRIVDSQVSVQTVYNNDVKIWSRPTVGDLNVAKRRLQAAGNQKLRIDFVFSKGPRNAASVDTMLTIFDKQLRSPSSPLGGQPIFYGAVVHTCNVLKSEQTPRGPVGIESEVSRNGELLDAREESSATRSLPALLAAFLALVAMW